MPFAVDSEGHIEGYYFNNDTKAPKYRVERDWKIIQDKEDDDFQPLVEEIKRLGGDVLDVKNKYTICTFKKNNFPFSVDSEGYIDHPSHGLLQLQLSTGKEGPMQGVVALAHYMQSIHLATLSC